VQRMSRYELEKQQHR